VLWTDSSGSCADVVGHGRVVWLVGGSRRLCKHPYQHASGARSCNTLTTARLLLRVQSAKAAMAAGNVNDERYEAVLMSSLQTQPYPRPQMFLQVAALLSGQQRSLVLDVWRAQYTQAVDQYLKDLERHSLLGCDAEGNITIHDVLRDLGRHLLRCNKKYMGSCLWVEPDRKLLVEPQKPHVCFLCPSCAWVLMKLTPQLLEGDNGSVLWVRKLLVCICDSEHCSGERQNTPLPADFIREDGSGLWAVFTLYLLKLVEPQSPHVCCIIHPYHTKAVFTFFAFELLITCA
jgi:hypothetical protein